MAGRAAGFGNGPLSIRTTSRQPSSCEPACEAGADDAAADHDGAGGGEGESGLGHGPPSRVQKSTRRIACSKSATLPAHGPRRRRHLPEDCLEQRAVRLHRRLEPAAPCRVARCRCGARARSTPRASARGRDCAPSGRSCGGSARRTPSGRAGRALGASSSSIERASVLPVLVGRALCSELGRRASSTLRTSQRLARSRISTM